MLSSLSQGGPQIGQVSAPPPPPNAATFRPPPSINVVPPPPAMLAGTIRKVLLPPLINRVKLVPPDVTSIKQVDAVDVFRYPIDKPVSVKRGQSALVPFLSGELKGGPCTLYNHGTPPSPQKEKTLNMTHLICVSL